MYLDITIKRASVEKQQQYEKLYKSTRRKQKGENLDKSFSIRRLSKRLNRSCVIGKLNAVSFIWFINFKTLNLRFIMFIGKVYFQEVCVYINTCIYM